MKARSLFPSVQVAKRRALACWNASTMRTKAKSSSMAYPYKTLTTSSTIRRSAFALSHARLASFSAGLLGQPRASATRSIHPRQHPLRSPDAQDTRRDRSRGQTGQCTHLHRSVPRRLRHRVWRTRRPAVSYTHLTLPTILRV